MSRAFPILSTAGMAALLPEVWDDELWASWKTLAFEFLVEKIKEVDAHFPDDPRERKERLRALSREHHLVYIVDRLRRRSDEGALATAAELTRAAQYILDRNLYPAESSAPFAIHTIENRRALVAARVNWHKLMRSAGVKPPGREGGWNEPERLLRGSAALFRALDKPNVEPAQRAELLRAYVERRLEHLVAVAREVASPNPRELNQSTKLLVHDLELALKRARRRS
jgi:hypothetical protein